MRSFDWDKAILGKLTATDFAEAAAAGVSAILTLILLYYLAGGG